jgi:hypothetical protein
MSYRAVDTNILSVVNVNADTFQLFVDKYNQVVDHLQNTVMTVSNTNAYNGNNTGNGFVIGILGATTLVANSALRGGNISTSGILTITSAAQVSNTLSVADGFTVTTGLSNVNTINVRGAANVANVLTVTSNTVLGSFLSVAANASFANNIAVKTDYVIEVSANSDLGSNTTSPQQLFAFLKSDFSSARIMVQSKKGSNTQVYEGILAHNGGTPQMAVYGVVSVPTNANNGIVSASSNTTHITVNYQQTAINTSTKTILHMVK